MLLKVSDGSAGWVLFDKVDSVHLISKDYTVRTVAELSALGDETVLNLISKDCLKGDPINVGIIEFEKEGTKRTALFTNVVFICNDSGDTLDRLSVDRRKGGK